MTFLAIAVIIAAAFFLYALLNPIYVGPIYQAADNAKDEVSL
jgi:hypothetical protein